MFWQRLIISVALCMSVASVAQSESIYTWVDSQGVKHFSQTPIAGIKAEKRELQGPAYAIKYIPDGDTIHLKNGWKIRLIGINTPEIGKRGLPSQKGAVAAARFLRKRLKNVKVRLVYDVERFDHYGRRLAYVYTEAGVSINAEIIKLGLAHVNTVPPNTEHIKHFLVLEGAARAAHLGLWKYAKYRQVLLDDSEPVHAGFNRIKGRIKRVKATKKYVYLKFNETFSASFPKDRFKQFFSGISSPLKLRNQTVQLRGWVSTRGKKRLLKLKDPLQLEGF